MNTTNYRAHDTLTEWQGQPRATIEAAQRDAKRHNDGCGRRGGYGCAIVVARDGSRCVDLDGDYVWPSHGAGNGAARWR